MEQSFSKETMLASLRDIRLPSEAAGGVLADWLVSIGLAALAALLCVLILRAVLAPTQRAKTVSLAEQLADIETLPEGAQRVALLRLLKGEAPDRYQLVSKDLYAPGQLDLAQLRAEVARLV